MILFLQYSYYSVVVFSPMREITVYTALYFFAVLIDNLVITRAVIIVQRTIAEQTVYVSIAVMARIVFTFFVSKKSTGISHF